MTLGLDHSLPRWLIDDTADITNARVFIFHTQEPRFIGEVLPDDEPGALLGGITISAGHGESLCRIIWIDDPVFDAEELCRSLREALEEHFAIRGRST